MRLRENWEPASYLVLAGVSMLVFRLPVTAMGCLIMARVALADRPVSVSVELVRDGVHEA